MMIALHKNARTTPALRAEIAASTDSNPPNLSRSLVRLRRIRLSVGGVSGAGSAGNVSSPAARERDHPVMNALSDTARDQQHGADAAREQFGGRRTVDLAFHTLGLWHGLTRCHGHRPVGECQEFCV